MMDGVLVIVLGLLGRGNAFLDALDAHDGNERHHLLLDNKRMVRLRFGKEQLRIRRNIHARRLRQDGRVLANEIFIDGRLGATAAMAFLEGKGRLGQPIKLRGIEPNGAVLFHLRHQLVRRYGPARILPFRRCRANYCHRPRP